jgi:photosystem II stability/assembly factor-like uncharacterized protein
MSWLEPVSAFPTNTIQGVSCPSSTVCFALGTYNNDESVVYESTDNGGKWTAATGPSAAYPDLAIACPTSSFCAVEEFGPLGDAFAMTRNGGVTWQQAEDSGLGANPSITQFACPSTEFCDGIEDGAIVSTTDGGQVWRRHPASNGTISSSCLSVRNCYVLRWQSLNKVASLYSSTNRGGTLRLIARLPVAHPEFVLGEQSLACTASLFCAVVQGAQVLVTASGGRHWTAEAFPISRVRTVALSCVAPSTCSVLEGSEFKSVSMVTTNGTHWSRVAFPSAVGYAPSIDCSTTLTCLASTQTSSIEELSGAIPTWTIQPVATGLPLLDVATCDPSGGCIADGAGSQATSADNGATWSFQADPSLSGDQFTSLVCPATATCLAAGYTAPANSKSGFILVTTDLGQSWVDASLPPGVSAVSSITCATPSICLAVQQDVGTGPPEILRSADGGLTWSWEAVSSSAFTGSVVQVVCTGTSCALVGADGEPASYSATSTDAGATWTLNLDPVASDAVLGGIACTTALDCVSSGAVKGGGLGQWITTDLASTDGGLNWTPVGGLDASITACSEGGCWASSPVFLNPLSPFPKQSLYASTDLGQTWTLFATPTGVTLSNVLGFTSDGAPIAVGENVSAGAVILVLPTWSGSSTHI